jgi:hypothetical protein
MTEYVDKRNIAPLHLESMTHTDSFIGAGDGDHDHSIQLKLRSINAGTVAGFQSESFSLLAAPRSRSTYTYSAVSLFQLLTEDTAKGLDMAFWS